MNICLSRVILFMLLILNTFILYGVQYSNCFGYRHWRGHYQSRGGSDLSIDALNNFCRKRGYKVTGSKKELMARVYVLYNISVSEQRGAKQQEASRKADYKSLVNCRFSAPFPINSVVFITSEDHEQIFVLLRPIKDALTSKIIFFCTSSRWVTSSLMSPKSNWPIISYNLANMTYKYKTYIYV